MMATIFMTITPTPSKLSTNDDSTICCRDQHRFRDQGRFRCRSRPLDGNRAAALHAVDTAGERIERSVIGAYAGVGPTERYPDCAAEVRQSVDRTHAIGSPPT